MAYIYQIINDINDKVYVGKTEFSIEKRWKEHCKDYKRKHCEKRPLYDAMNKYGVEHFHISLLEETDLPEEREIYWIEKLQSFKYGYNATLGGDSKRYLDYELIIKTYLQVLNIAETARLCQAHPDSVKNILELNDIPIVPSSVVSAKKLQKQIGMYDKQNNLIKTFPSISDAARFLIENNLTIMENPSKIVPNISRCAKGRRKTAFGYCWKYL